MATTTAPAKKTAKKTSAKTTAKTGAAKKSAKKTSAKTTAKTGAAKKSAKKTASTAPNAPSLFEREPAALLETAGYAFAGVSHDVVELARTLPERVEALRNEESLASLRERLGTDAKRYLASLEQVVDTKAAEGRKVVDDVSKDERVARVLDQTAATRSQLKSALTSVTKTADVAAEAAGDQADTARSQVKGAVSTLRGSGDEAGSAVKGAVTSVRKVADVAFEAATKQAGTAASQVKGAVTSVRRTAGTVADAATDETE